MENKKENNHMSNASKDNTRAGWVRQRKRPTSKDDLLLATESFNKVRKTGISLASGQLLTESCQHSTRI